MCNNKIDEFPTILPGSIFQIDPDQLCKKIKTLAHEANYSNTQVQYLGQPAYRSQGDYDSYLRSALRTNYILWEHFESTYQQLLNILSAYFFERIYLSLWSAIPGFHIIRASRYRPYSGGGAHIDCPYKNIYSFKKNIISPQSHYSFTVLVSHEGDDIGLDLWMSTSRQEEALTLPPDVFIKYPRGKVVIFPSSIVHRIAPFTSDGQHPRITLQGHIIRLSNRLVTYW